MPVKYVAELAHVREVSLLGSADLGFWAERLRGEGLTPVQYAGWARVLVVSCNSKFFGVRFRELSFSVFVHQPDASEGSDAAFLRSGIQLVAVLRVVRAHLVFHALPPRDNRRECRVAGFATTEPGGANRF